MAAGATYTPIATTTLGSAQTSYTFSSISGSYTDLVLVIYVPTNSTTDDLYLQFNSDTGTNYSATWLRGNGTTASSVRSSNLTGARLTDYSSPTASTSNTSIVNIMNYSNTTTYKTVLNRGNNASAGVDAFVDLWRSTSAINAIKIYPNSGSMASGSTFTLYGVLNA